MYVDHRSDLFQLKQLKEETWKNSSLRKQPTFREIATWALAKRRLSNECRNFHTDDVHYPDLGSASDWWKENSLATQPIRSTTKIWVVHVIGMEFLRSLLRRRFARAQVGTSRNVGCFSGSKNSGLNGNRTHDLCDTGAALLPTELSSQLGAGQLRVRIYPVDGEWLNVWSWQKLSPLREKSSHVFATLTYDHFIY